MGYSKKELNDSTVYIPNIKSGTKVSVLVFYPGIPVNGKIGKEYMPPLILKGAPNWFDNYVISIPHQHTTDWTKVKNQYENEMTLVGLQTLNISVGIYSGSGNGSTSIQKSLTSISGLKNLMLMDPSGGAGTTSTVKNNGTSVFMVYNPKNWKGDANAGIRNGFPALVKAVGSNITDTKSDTYDHNQIPVIFLNTYKTLIESNLSSAGSSAPVKTTQPGPTPGPQKSSGKGSKTQKYFNAIDSTKKNTISLIVKTCKEKGITSPIFQSALCGIVSKECDFVPKGEGSYAGSTATYIRKIFGERFDPYTDSQIDVIKKDQKLFFSVIYGDQYGNGKASTQDGWSFRGRGFNQLTFRGNYKKIGSGINLGIEAKPELIENLEIAAKALVQYYTNGFSDYKNLVAAYGISNAGNTIDTINGIKDVATAVRILYQMTAGPGKKDKKSGKWISLHYEENLYTGGDGDLVFPNDTPLFGFTKARNRAPLFYKLITGGSLPPNPDIPPAVVIPPTQDGPISVTASTPDNTNTTSVDEPSDPIEQDSDNTDDKAEDNPVPVDQVVPGLTNVFPPTIKVEPIKFEHKSESKKYIKEWSSTVGTRPFVWYNSYQIDDGDIEYFALYNDGILPALTLTFRDTQNLMRDKGFPLDDTKIKIFLSSRTKNIKHILLEFKIKNFSIDGETLTIIGVLNVNGLHLRKFKSYSQKTSFFALQDICKEVGLGFNSNISDSNDKMTWLNTGIKVYDFMDDILSYSYVSDEGFSYGYVDFYYNFNYVDIEKELSRDNSEDKGIDSSGLGINITGDSDKVSRIALGNDKSFQESDSYISEYKILNNSTSISLEKGYLNVSKYYDTVKKEYLIFDVDSITSEGDKTIIMKASPQDTDFYKENVNTTYVGKLDPDNAHTNYNYSYVHNLQNIEDLQKIGLKLTLSSPNYNLYRFQKIKVLITNEGATPASKAKNSRISGEWFITDIKFVYAQGEYKQDISLIKRELDISDEELTNEQIPESEMTDAEPPLECGVEATTNPTDLTNTDAPIPPDSYQPNTTPVNTQTTTTQTTTAPAVANTSPVVKVDTTPIKPGKYDLDYLIMDEDIKSKVKSNNGTSFNLVLVDGDKNGNGTVTTDFVANAYFDMKAAAKKDGITLSLASGFRPAFGPVVYGKSKKGFPYHITTQESLRRDPKSFNKNHPDWKKYPVLEDFIMKASSGAYSPATAAPKSSNHGNGVALDFNTGSRVPKKGKPALGLTNAGKTYQWLVNNGWRFGFVREVATEEWHFDYLPDLAKKGPYGKLANQGDKNLYYGDLGLDNIKIS